MYGELCKVTFISDCFI